MNSQVKTVIDILYGDSTYMGDSVRRVGSANSKTYNTWFVIGTVSPNTNRKLVRNLKYTLDQFVMNFLGALSVLGTVEDIRSNKICRFRTRH